MDSSAAGSIPIAFDVVVEAPLPAALDLRRLEALARHVLMAEGARGRWSVTVALVDNERIRELHRDFMGIDEATDVMTFPLDEGPGRSGGEIAISVERAAEQAPEFDHSAATEVEFLLAHGLLHLCGWGDAVTSDRARMLERQAALLEAFKRAAVAEGERSPG